MDRLFAPKRGAQFFRPQTFDQRDTVRKFLHLLAAAIRAVTRNNNDRIGPTAQPAILLFS